MTHSRLAVLAAASVLAACAPGQQTSEAPQSATTSPAAVPNSVQHAYNPGTDKTPSTEVSYSGPKLVLQAADVGVTAAEPTIGVANDGTAYFAGSRIVVDTSTAWAGAATDIHRSTDGGLTWKSVQPNLGGIGYPPANADPMIYVDQATGRVFTFDLTAACVFLSYSDDKGETWTSNPLACGNVPIDHQTIVAAKPVDGLPGLTGYPNVLVWCSNRVADGTCGRSFDGGITWSPAGDPYLGANANDGACGSLGGHLAADAEGTLYVASAHCGYPQISVSTDSGLTWTEYTVSTIGDPDTHTAAATDDAGNVYYVWMDAAQKPYLSYSKDHGKTWSAPMMIAPPGVYKANFPVVRAKTPGHVAVAFPSTASKARTATPWDYTMTMTTDVFADKPVWVSATANDPALPVHRGACLGRCDGMWDFIDIQISATGQAWSSLSNDCHGDCLAKGAAVADHDGEGVAVRQIDGPAL